MEIFGDKGLAVDNAAVCRRRQRQRPPAAAGKSSQSLRLLTQQQRFTSHVCLAQVETTKYCHTELVRIIIWYAKCSKKYRPNTVTDCRLADETICNYTEKKKKSIGYKVRIIRSAFYPFIFASLDFRSWVKRGPSPHFLFRKLPVDGPQVRILPMSASYSSHAITTYLNLDSIHQTHTLWSWTQTNHECVHCIWLRAELLRMLRIRQIRQTGLLKDGVSNKRRDFEVRVVINARRLGPFILRQFCLHTGT